MYMLKQEHDPQGRVVAEDDHAQGDHELGDEQRTQHPRQPRAPVSTEREHAPRHPTFCWSMLAASET